MNKIEEEQKRNELVSGKINEMDTSKFVAHTLTIEDAEKHFETNLKLGLTSEEAKVRLDKEGPNELEKEDDKSLFERIME